MLEVVSTDSDVDVCLSRSIVHIYSKITRNTTTTILFPPTPPLSRYNLFYVPSAIRWELSLVFLLTTLNLSRMRLAARGNKTENMVPLIYSLLLTAPTAMGYAFFFSYQSYVLHVDRWLNGSALSFVVLEATLSVFTLILFRRALAGW